MWLQAKTTILIGLSLISLASLTSCGFQPLYGNYAPSASNQMPQKTMERIKISNIPDRSGQFLRNRLIDLINPHGEPSNPAYMLVVSKLSEAISDLDITETADSTRAQIKIDTTIALMDPQTQKPVFSRTIRSISSYNILSSEFATRVSEQNARENALIDLARQTQTQLALFFARENTE